MRTRLPLSAAACLLLAGNACFFDFDRALGLEPGDVSGRLLRDDQRTAAPYAEVRVGGTGRVQRADSDGAFRVRGLAAGGWSGRFVDDANGDGWPELAAHRAFAITMETHADGLLGQTEAVPSFVLLGDVVLDGIVKVRGRIVDDQGDVVAGARVLVYRSESLPPASLGGAGGVRTALEVDLGIEAETAAAADGRFRMPAVAAGDFTVVALWCATTPAECRDNGTFLMSLPAERTAAEGDDLDVGDLALGAPPATRQVQLEVAPAPAADERVLVQWVPRGRTPVEYTSATFPAAGEPNVFVGSSSLSLAMPVGEWDVFVSTSLGRTGATYGRMATRPGKALVVWGLVRLSDVESCAGTDASGAPIRDCDSDSLQGLPPLANYPPTTAAEEAALAIWGGCAPQCRGAFGTAALEASCDVGGETWDCDDDGDGQSDVTEGLFCYGPGGGNDADGDGLCGPDDPYPQCAENDPEHPNCGADRSDDFTPPGPRPEYTEPIPTPTDGGPDAGDDGGPADGGPDAGPFSTGAALIGDGTSAGFFHIVGGGPGTIVSGTATGALDLGNGCTATLQFGEFFIAGLTPTNECAWMTLGLTTQPADAGGMYGGAQALVPLANGGVLVAGQFEGQLRFQGETLATPPVLSPVVGERDIYWVRLDAAGEPVGEIETAGPTTAATTGATIGGGAALPDGSVILSGAIYEELVFNRAGAASPSATAAGSQEGWVAHILADGSVDWLFTLRADMSASVGSVATLLHGAGGSRVFAAARVSQGTILADTSPLDAADGQYALLMLDASDGTELWVGQMDNALASTSALASSSAAGRVAWGGRHNAPVTLPSQTPGNTQLLAPVAAGQNGYVAFYDEEGELREVARADTGPAGTLTVGALSFSGAGDLTVGGTYRGEMQWQDGPRRWTDGETWGFVTRLNAPAWGHGWTHDVAGSGGSNLSVVGTLESGAVKAFPTGGGTTWFGGHLVEDVPTESGAVWDIGPGGQSGQETLLPFGSLCELGRGPACADRRCEVDLLFETQGRCTHSCAVNADCETGACLLLPNAGFNVCVNNEVSPAQCASNDHCTPNVEVCPPRTMTCTAICIAGGCAFGDACNVDTGICEPDCFDENLVTNPDSTCPFPDQQRCSPLSDGWACRLDCGAFAQCGTEFCGLDGQCSAGDAPTAGVYDDTWSLGAGDWLRLSPATQPPPLTLHALASTSDGPLLFGGRTDVGVGPGAVWRFTGGDWLDTTAQASPPGGSPALHAGAGLPASEALFFGTLGEGSFYSYDAEAMASGFFDEAGTSPPGTRSLGAMAWDGADGVYLFGGTTGPTDLADMHRFDVVLRTWSSVTVDAGIAPRFGAAMARWDDAGTPKLLLAGGWNTRDGLLDDTWSYEPGTQQWTRVGANTLGKRADHALAWDGNRVIAYGGIGGRSHPAVRDVLEWTGSLWRRVKLTAPAPPPRTSVRLAEAPAGLLLYGGDEGPPPELLFEDEHTRNNNGLFGASRSDAGFLGADGAAYVTTSDGSLWRFGGVDDHYRLLDELWRRHPDGMWENVMPLDATWPARRTRSAGAVHPANGKLYFYGGKDEYDVVFDDLWTFDTVTGLWTDLGSGSAAGPRASHVMAADPVTGLIIIAAGAFDNGFASGTVTLAADGTVGFPSLSPELSDRIDATVIVSPDGVHVIGGLQADMNGDLTALDDEWIWTGTEWVAGQTLLRPWAAALGVYVDSGSQRLFLYGGDAGDAAGGVFPDISYRDLTGVWRDGGAAPWGARARGAAINDGEQSFFVGGSTATRAIEDVGAGG